MNHLFNKLIACVLVTLAALGTTVSAQENMQLSLKEALQLMRNDNKSIQIANKEIEWSKSERQRLNSFWYPKVSATGAYVHMTNPVEVKQSMSEYTKPLVDHIHSVDPSEQLISGLLNHVGEGALVVPLLPQNMTSIDVVAALPVFTGGKRIYANKIGGLMVDISEVNRDRVEATQQALVIQTYYGVRLAQRIVLIRQETLDALELHYQNALKLEANGLLNKTDRLFFQVNRDEAKRELEVAIKNSNLISNTFKTIVNITSPEAILPTTPLFINRDLPNVDYFKSLVGGHNYLLNGLEMRQKIQRNEIKIAQSAYMPNIEVFAKQSLYTNGIPKNLFPRTMVGVGFTYNLFDGLDREKKIKQAKISSYIIDIERQKLTDDVTLAVDKFYNQTKIALDNIIALETTKEMAKEIVRARKSALVEGMATSSEVVDAELLLSKVRTAMIMAYYEFDAGLIDLLVVCGIPDAFHDYCLSGIQEQKINNSKE